MRADTHNWPSTWPAVPPLKLGQKNCAISLKLLRGCINVKSSDKGTVFELYFPVTREETAAEKQEVPLEDYLGHGENVLVVDD